MVGGKNNVPIIAVYKPCCKVQSKIMLIPKKIWEIKLNIKFFVAQYNKIKTAIDADEIKTAPVK
jgi:hypothetical protein